MAWQTSNTPSRAKVRRRVGSADGLVMAALRATRSRADGASGRQLLLQPGQADGGSGALVRRVRRICRVNKPTEVTVASRIRREAIPVALTHVPHHIRGRQALPRAPLFWVPTGLVRIGLG